MSGWTISDCGKYLDLQEATWYSYNIVNNKSYNACR